jgi:mannosyl-oligosaccharide alpha-1,2-mannosidase
VAFSKNEIRYGPFQRYALICDSIADAVHFSKRSAVMRGTSRLNLYSSIPAAASCKSHLCLLFEMQAISFRRYRWPILILVAITFLATITPLFTRFTPSQSPIFPFNNHRTPTASTPASISSVRGSHVCPTAPPNPALNPDTQGRFNWRTVATHHSIEQSQYSSLPAGNPPPRPSVQHSFRTAASTEADEKIASRKEAVRDVFKRCWKSCQERAWTKDELAPISGGARDTFGSWGATLVDSLDTLWIMGMKTEYADAVDAAVQIDFGSKIDGEINVIETIIRYLGGFLGAYDVSGCHDARLLNKAIEVADMAYDSFDTPNRMPVSRWSPKKAVDGERTIASRIDTDCRSSFCQCGVHTSVATHWRYALL